ncbi:MAG TPA: hypothetical protein VNW92_13610 [Polyangiaceae bacterium]|jgi:hypothetical protein|nr:hypothetical protein [Polyangiaceae bacterium]
MTPTTSPVSVALLNFAGTLARGDPERFRPKVKMLSRVGYNWRDEETILFRLADQAVRVWGAALLELKDRKFDADTLRCLPPITDRNTSEAATAALAALDSGIVSHAKVCAASVAGEAGSPEFIGSQAAYAAIALANSCDDQQKRGVYENAAALLAELRSGFDVLH